MGQSQGDEERGGARRKDAKLAFHYLTSAASADTLLSPERDNKKSEPLVPLTLPGPDVAVTTATQTIPPGCDTFITFDLLPNHRSLFPASVPPGGNFLLRTINSDPSSPLKSGAFRVLTDLLIGNVCF